MTVVGMTGHQHLDHRVAAYAEGRIRTELRDQTPLVGATSLADGADQLFADLVLEMGGSIMAIIPAANYESSFATAADRRKYLDLVARSDEVIRLPFKESSEEAFWAAGKEMVNQAEIVLAVWDGEASRGLGGTGDVVTYAREMGREVVIIWPDGAERS